MTHVCFEIFHVHDEPRVFIFIPVSSGHSRVHDENLKINKANQTHVGDRRRMIRSLNSPDISGAVTWDE